MSEATEPSAIPPLKLWQRRLPPGTMTDMIVLALKLIAAANRDPDKSCDLAYQPGVRISLLDDVVLKQGRRVRRCEEHALKLVKNLTTVPVPEVHFAVFGEKYGTIGMALVEGKPLDMVWSTFSDDTKKKDLRGNLELHLPMESNPKTSRIPNYRLVFNG